MLSFNPALMASYSDSQLTAALISEGFFTPAEKELTRRLDLLAGQESAEEIEARIEKSYESPLEQSKFRAELLNHILALLDENGSKKDLIKSIKNAVENSYVEL